MYDNVEIHLVPDYETLGDNLGYDDTEREDSDLLELEQGNYIEDAEIEDDGTFEIPEDYHGEIESDQDFYVLVERGRGHFEKEAAYYIEQGRYKIEGDTIKRLGRSRQLYS